MEAAKIFRRPIFCPPRKGAVPAAGHTRVSAERGGAAPPGTSILVAPRGSKVNEQARNHFEHIIDITRFASRSLLSSRFSLRISLY